MTQTLSDQLAVRLSEDGRAASWQKILPYGVFKHPRHGTLDFRESFFDHVKKHFDQRTRGIDLQVDFDHEAGKSAGWIKSLDVRQGDGLYAEVDWTQSGRKAIEDGEYRYASAEYGPHFDEKTGKVTPKVLAGFCLTNRPFMKVLPAVQLSEEQGDPDEVDLTEIELIESDEYRISLAEDKYPEVDEADFAGPHRSFPIRNQNDVHDAWALRGHAADPEAVGRKILAIAKRKGLSAPDAAKLGEVTNGQARESAVLAKKGANHTAECDDDCEMTHLAEPSAAQQVQSRTAKKKAGKTSPDTKKADDKKADDKKDDGEEDPAAAEQPQQLPYRTDAAPPAAAGRRTGDAGGKSKKPAGNEGALQPGQMTGPKPHIIRGRKPDPTNEAAHMSEQNENTPAENSDAVALAEQKEVAKRLSDKVTALETERTTLSERLAAMELRERQRDIADDVRRLSEERTVRLGDEDVTAKFGIPTVVASAYSEMALSEAGFTREGVFTLLSQLKKVGMVALTEAGSAHAGVENDPDANTGVSLDEKIYNRAVKLAEAAGKDYLALDPAERMTFAIRAERELKG